MRSPNNAPSVAQALALGALQGPAELLPISSSAHTIAIPRLFGWSYGELDPELRKSFEVALHAGTALALAISLRGEILRWPAVTTAACVPPAIAGYALERKIESRLGTPVTIAAGLLAGSAAMLLADRAPERRSEDDTGIRDGLWLGIAQSIALIPGVSRSGITLSAARWLGFGRRYAARLSTRVGLPVLAGASLLKAIRLTSSRLAPGLARMFAVGAAASFASTLVCATLMRGRYPERLAPYAAYRIGLAGVILWRAGSTARPRGRGVG